MAALQLLTLLLALTPALADNYNYFFKRSLDVVDSICFQVTSSKNAVSLANADGIYVGNSKNVKGRGVLCASPTVVYSSGSQWNLSSSLPPTISSTAISASVWAAGPSDSVTYTAENGVPSRSLAVLGPPIPLVLSGPSTADPSPSVATLDIQSAADFNADFSSALAAFSKYLDWFFSSSNTGNNGNGKGNGNGNNNGAQATIIIQRDPDAPNENMYMAIYIMFLVGKDGSVTGHMLVMSYSLSDVPLLPSAKQRRRLMSLRGPRRSLLQTIKDKAAGKTCSTTCSLVNGRRVCRCL